MSRAALYPGFWYVRTHRKPHVTLFHTAQAPRRAAGGRADRVFGSAGTPWSRPPTPPQSPSSLPGKQAGGNIALTCQPFPWESPIEMGCPDFPFRKSRQTPSSPGGVFLIQRKAFHPEFLLCPPAIRKSPPTFRGDQPASGAARKWGYPERVGSRMPQAGGKGPFIGKDDREQARVEGQHPILPFLESRACLLPVSKASIPSHGWHLPTKAAGEQEESRCHPRRLQVKPVPGTGDGTGGWGSSC